MPGKCPGSLTLSVQYIYIYIYIYIYMCVSSVLGLLGFALVAGSQHHAAPNIPKTQARSHVAAEL